MAGNIMRRTSVMLEVSDEVYIGLVEPLKKEKSFAKLVASLLSAYLGDSYIRSVVDDTFDETRKAVVSGFEDSVSAMEEALANMGLLTDQLQAHSMAGQRKFRQVAEEQSKETPPAPLEVSKNPEVGVQQLQERVEGLEKSMQEGFNRIISMLTTTGGVAVPTVAPEQRADVPVSKPSYGGIFSERPAEVISVFEEEDSNGEPQDHVESEVSAFLSDLVADFGSF